MKPVGRVYLITNLVNGKQYVGVTTQSIEKRWAVHLCSARTKKTAIAGAIRKYGRDAFRVELIEEVEGTIDDLAIAEVKSIAEHRTRAPHGYNLTPGGSINRPTPEAIERMRQDMRMRWTDPKYRRNQSTGKSQRNLDPAVRRAHIAGVRKNAVDPAWLKIVTDAARKRALDPAWRSSNAIEVRRRAKDPAWLEAVRAAARKRVQNPEWARKNAAQLKRMRKRKELLRAQRLWDL